MSIRITPDHLNRAAVVYVRQSSRVGQCSDGIRNCAYATDVRRRVKRLLTGCTVPRRLALNSFFRRGRGITHVHHFVGNAVRLMLKRIIGLSEHELSLDDTLVCRSARAEAAHWPIRASEHPSRREAVPS